MSIINGILKTKQGDELRPLTSAAQVEVTDSQRLSEIFDESGKVKAAALPDILNKFKGTFTGEAALPETGEAGDYAICTDTDTVWIWDAEKEGGAGWIDTGNKGSVTSVNGKTGDVVIGVEDINGLQTALNAKVATADIVDNVTSEDTDKPLSANQGKMLNDLITSVQGTASDAETAAAAAQETATAAGTAAASAAATAAEIDFAIVENGEGAPANLREAGIYFEKDAVAAVEPEGE